MADGCLYYKRSDGVLVRIGGVAGPKGDKGDKGDPGSGGGGGGGDVASIGFIGMWGSAPVPAEYLVCDGSAVPAGAEYDALRAMYPTALPDLRDRFIFGAGAKAVGDTGGAATVTLTEAQIASHTHVEESAGSHTHPPGPMNNPAGGASTAFTVAGGGGANSVMLAAGQGTAGNATPRTGADGAHVHPIKPAGGGQPHENMPPFIVMQFVIRAKA